MAKGKKSLKEVFSIKEPLLEFTLRDSPKLDFNVAIGQTQKAISYFEEQDKHKTLGSDEVSDVVGAKKVLKLLLKAKANREKIIRQIVDQIYDMDTAPRGQFRRVIKTLGIKWD